MIIENINYIDCDVDPFCPNKDWTVKNHQKIGLINFNQENPFLFFPEKSKTIKDVEEELQNKKILNANALDHLLGNTFLIPKEWEKISGYVFFFGTTYNYPEEPLFSVRCMFFRNGSWQKAFFWSSISWLPNSAVAVLESSIKPFTPYKL